MENKNKISQQILIYDRLKETFQSTLDSNRRLEGKALLFITNSSFITGLVASSGIGTDPAKGYSLLLTLIICLVCLLTVLVYWKGVSLIAPKFRSIPGTLDVDRLYTRFVDVSECEAYKMLMKELASSTKKEIESNTERANAAKTMAYLVGAQALAVGFYFFVKFVIAFV